MKKFGKIILWIAGIVVVLLILAVIGLKLFFPAEKVRALAIEKGSQALGRQLTVEGLDMSFWGGIGVELQNITVSNPPGFGDEPMLVAENLDVKVQILPLIFGDIRVDKLIVNKPEVVLVKKADGTNNYTFAAVEEKAPPELAEKTTPEARAAAATVAFDKLEVNDAYLKYTDDSSGFMATIVNMDLATSLKIPRRNVYESSGRLQIDSVMVKNGMPLPALAVRLEYQAEYDLDRSRLDLQKADLRLNGLDFKLKGEATLPEEPTDGMTARGNLKSDRVTVADLLGFFSEEQKAMLKDFKVAGDFALDVDVEYTEKKEKPLVYSGTAIISDMSLSKKDLEGELKLKKALVDFEPDNLRMNLEDATFNNEPLKGHLTVDNFDDPLVNGELAGSINLAYLKPFLPAKDNHDISGGTRFNMKFSGKASDYKNLRFSGDLVVKDAAYNSNLMPEPVEAFSLEVYFDNNVVNVRQFSGRTRSGRLEFTGRFDNLVPYLMADSIQARTIHPSVDGKLNGDINLAFLNVFLPAKGHPELTGLATMELKVKGNTGDYSGFKPYGTLSITDASYTDSLLPEPLRHFEASMSLIPDTIKIDKMMAQFVSSDVTFAGNLSHPFPYLLPIETLDRSKMTRPVFNFTLTSKRFDVDKLFPEAVPGAGTEQAPALSADSISMVILPDIDGNGTFTVDTMIYSRVEFDHISGKIKIRDRKIECYDVTGKVYSGSVSGNTTIDLTSFENPRYTGTFQASQVEADDFVSRFSKFGGYLFGKIDLNGNYNAQGWEAEDFLNSLTMNGTSSMKSGKLVTSGALYSAINKVAGAAGQSFEKEQALRELMSNIEVRDGKVKLDKLNTSLGKVGDVDLNGYYSFSGQLDYEGSILLSQEWSQDLLSKGGLVGGLAGILSDKSVKRVKLPLSIGGTTDNPKVEIDYSSILESAKNDLIEEKGKDLLKDLFKKK
ncbi:MAG: AsmA family protein [candidate division Zixibacteria bacterium]|nr:AsmA family protein [candidate division Zixibacteria bacterium]